MNDKPRKKDLSELTLMDNYMFGAVMEDPKLIKPLIEIILGMKLVRIEFAEEQMAIKKRYAGKGIQLDLYVEDENGVIYNVEVQTTDKKNLPKRMRYYQAIIDLHILSPGANYNSLRKSYVIFLCNYDPFGKDRIVYRFENRCMEEPELRFGDEMIKVVINTRGTKGEVSDELRELIRYLNDQVVSGAFTQELDNAVNSVKANEERRHEYMVWYAHEMELREEGREEGLKEGLKEGEKRGEKKGEEKKTVADIQRLIKKLGYTEEQAMNFMDIPAEEHSKYALLLNEKAVSYEP